MWPRCGDGGLLKRALGVSPPARAGQPPSPLETKRAPRRAVALGKETRKFAPAERGNCGDPDGCNRDNQTGR